LAFANSIRHAYGLTNANLNDIIASRAQSVAKIREELKVEE